MRAPVILSAALALAPFAADAAVPETIRFPSADGKTELVGYLVHTRAAGRASGDRAAARARRRIFFTEARRAHSRGVERAPSHVG